MIMDSSDSEDSMSESSTEGTTEILIKTLLMIEKKLGQKYRMAYHGKNAAEEASDAEKTSHGGLQCNTLSAGGSSAEGLNQPCSSSLQETEKNDETDTEEDEEELLLVDKPSKPFKCLRCGKQFSFQGNLSLHIGTHTGKRPFACPHDECGQKFTQSCSLKSHICSHINKGDSSDGIQLYLKNHSVTTYSCDVCGNLYTLKRSLEYHKNSHSNQKSFKGNSLRAKALERNRGVRRRSNTKKRPFSCPKRTCSKSFAQRSTLNAHICTHMSGVNSKCSSDIQKYLDQHTFKTYVCDSCGKVFTQKLAKENHVLTHSAEKLFVCKFKDCGKSFLQKRYLELHSRIHLNIRPYVCSVEDCGKSFTRLVYLNIHLRTHGID